MDGEPFFIRFLEEFIPLYKEKSKVLNEASWILETTGTSKAAGAVAAADESLKLLFSQPDNYRKLLRFRDKKEIQSPQLQRILFLLISYHKGNMAPEELLKKISVQESSLSQAYVQFRPIFEGKKYTENDLIDILKKETNKERRKSAWEAGKKIGEHLADPIRELVRDRNLVARKAGYSDFYRMQLDLQEIDETWLLRFLDDFSEDSRSAYEAVREEIDRELSVRYQVRREELGPWAWADPFCQEDPLRHESVDDLLEKTDLVEAAKIFFSSLGYDIQPILDRSDLFEREGKNQHAFCTHIDRKGDVRILTNLRSSGRWLDTLLHELGHAVYELGYDDSLPWVLRSPPHMITTEAVALLMGRQAYDPSFLQALLQRDDLNKKLQKGQEAQRRRQLLFSRWVLVMVHFEAALYADPERDLNALWWSLVERYQKIKPPPQRAGKHDWACKYHIGLAPVYYHSYLLGEFFASGLKSIFNDFNRTPSLYGHENVGSFLKGRLFYPGNRMRWDVLIEKVTGNPLEYHSWIRDFGG